MYAIPAPDELLSQGDIFRRRCAFPYTASFVDDFLIVRAGQENVVGHSQLADAWADGSETAIFPAQSSDYSIILSNSCDAESQVRQPLELLLMGAVLPLDSMPEKNRPNCRSQKLIRFHYLQPNEHAGFPESFVHFGLVSLVRQEALVQSKLLRILTLKSPHREDLGHRFGEFISRVALP